MSKMKEIAQKRNIFIDWLWWRYSVILPKLILRWKSVLRFILEYFSVVFFLRTFFAPWKREIVSYGSSIDIKRYAETFIINIFSRLMGMIMRTALIITGLVVEILVIVTGFLLILFWILMPAVIIIGLLLSLRWISISI